MQLGVSRSWIGNLLSAAETCPIPGDWELRPHLDAFERLVPWMAHGALDRGATHALGADRARFVELQNSFSGTAVEQYVRDARRLARERSLRIRDGNVGLRCANMLTARSRPPPAGPARQALQTLLRNTNALLRNAKSDTQARPVIISLVGAHAALAIHAFRDGNGRTARHYFAANVARHIGPAPTAILAWLLLGRSGAHRYHQCFWLLRAGDPLPMIDLFVEGERMASDVLKPHMADGLASAQLLSDCYDLLDRTGVLVGDPPPAMALRELDN